MDHAFFDELPALDELPAFDALPSQTTPRSCDDLMAEINGSEIDPLLLPLSSPSTTSMISTGGFCSAWQECFAENEITEVLALSNATSPVVSQTRDETAPTPNGLPHPAPLIVYPKLARGGGNKKDTKESTRQVNVLTKDGIALWEPRKGYKDQIQRLTDFIEDEVPSTAKFSGGVKHPILGVYGFYITDEESKMIARRMYAKRETPDKAFGQLMTYLGMRSRTDKNDKVRTLFFDPEAWNRVGYRLVTNGDCKGGAPKINYLPVP